MASDKVLMTAAATQSPATWRTQSLRHYQRPHSAQLKHISHSATNVLRARRGVIRMLIVVVLTFALCNLPFHARKIWQYWYSINAFCKFGCELLISFRITTNRPEQHSLTPTFSFWLLVQLWQLRRSVQLQCPVHAAHVPRYVLQFGRQPHPVRLPQPQFPQRNARDPVLFAEEDQKRVIGTTTDARPSGNCSPSSRSLISIVYRLQLRRNMYLWADLQDILCFYNFYNQASPLPFCRFFLIFRREPILHHDLSLLHTLCSSGLT